MANSIKLPPTVQQVLTTLQKAGFLAYVVGGCVRDSIVGNEPKDWDIATSAQPDQIQQLFKRTFYANQFGTVTVMMNEDQIEVTTFRADGTYTDHRRPDKVQFSQTLQEDVERRDFTMNALAYDGEQIVDYFSGVADLKVKTIRAVGDPIKRFQEDALRMLRAIRFSSQLGFSIEPQTWQALCEQKDLIKHISQERIRDELIKMISSDDSYKAIWQLHTSGLLQYIIPELEEGSGVEQNLHHIYTVFTHNIFALQFCPSDDWRVRLAALLHDVGKPKVKEGSGKHATFHQHEHVGAKLTRTIMRRLAFANDDIAKVTHLVRHHMFYYNMNEITDAGVRRLLQRVGKENIQDLLAVRIADRLGSGVFKDKPLKLIELEKRLEYVQQDPISTSMLEMNGDILQSEFKMPKGPKIGVLLHRLLDEVIEDPKRNASEYLRQRSTELIPEISKLSDEEARNIMKQYREALADMNAFKGV